MANGMVIGIGAHAAAQVTPRLGLRGELARYWNRPSRGDVTLDWSQTRALLSVEWTFGADADHVAGYR